MNKKILLCALLMLFTSAFQVDARSKRKKAHAKAHTAQVTTNKQERYDEIDNFDFLYSGADEFDYDYDVSLRNGLIDEAFTHMGARYVYGSKGPYTFDCSGFTGYVYGKMGINIGYCSRDQYAQNTPIRDSEMQRGDLVFFKGRGGGRGVGHVGIVVDVDPVTRSFNFIHASVSRGITVSNSRETYYASRYIGARRVQ